LKQNGLIAILRCSTAIHVHFIPTVKSLGAKHVERAMQLSAEEYRLASITLGQTAKITYTSEVCDA
jgi:uncharacterized OsmC-like protein